MQKKPHHMWPALIISALMIVCFFFFTFLCQLIIPMEIFHSYFYLIFACFSLFCIYTFMCECSLYLKIKEECENGSEAVTNGTNLIQNNSNFSPFTFEMRSQQTATVPETPIHELQLSQISYQPDTPEIK